MSGWLLHTGTDMFKFPDLDRRTAAIGFGALTAGIAIGYNLVRRKSQRRVEKIYTRDDPISNYIKDNSLRIIPAQEKLMEVTQKHARGRMLGDTVEIQFLQLLCKAINAKKTLDIGVFTGYSAMSIALVLPEDGKVVACDVSNDYANVGRPYWKEAGVEHKIDLRIAPAEQTLQHLVESGETGTYDYAFIDADKEGYQTYFEYCLKLVRKGGIIAFDNTLQNGNVVDASNGNSSVAAIRNLNRSLHKDSRIDMSFLWLGDGTTLCLVK